VGGTGDFVGALVGAREGVKVGKSEGVREGTNDGLVLGASDGASDGTLVGLSDIVGSLVGTEEAVFVGASVSISGAFVWAFFRLHSHGGVYPEPGTVFFHFHLSTFILPLPFKVFWLPPFFPFPFLLDFFPFSLLYDFCFLSDFFDEVDLLSQFLFPRSRPSTRSPLEQPQSSPPPYSPSIRFLTFCRYVHPFFLPAPFLLLLLPLDFPFFDFFLPDLEAEGFFD